MLGGVKVHFQKTKTLAARNQWAWNVFRSMMKIISWSLRPWTTKAFTTYLKQEVIENDEFNIDYQKLANKSSFTVMMVIGSLGPGGAERQLTLLANGLANNSEEYCPSSNIRVIVVCLKCSSAPHDFFRDQLSQKIKIVDLSEYIGVPAKCRSDEILLKRWWFRSSSSILKKLLAVIQEEQPDVVHGWLDQIAVLSGLAAVRCKVPRVILSTRNVNPSHFILDRPFFWAGLRVLLKFRSVTIMNNSEAGARDYENWLKIDKGSIKTIHNGFDLDKFLNISKNKFFFDDNLLIVGSVFRFSLEKNPQLWLKVVSLVSKQFPQARFVLLGDGYLERKIHHWIRDLQLTHFIKLVKPTPLVYEIMSGFDVFLLTSKFEGLPNVLVESQALGIPVVSTNAGGAKETFYDNYSGILVDSMNAQEIADAVLALLKDFQLRKNFSDQALIWTKENFSQEKMVYKHINLYNRTQGSKYE